MRIIIERGTYADYASLAHLHYRAGRPATIARVLRAVLVGSPLRPRARELVGVLVVSMPVLNASWRDAAWPDLAKHLSRAGPARRARILNGTRGVRCLSRVIVDPRARGLGVACALVRGYLRRPLSRHTEALTSVDEFAGFFARAGMRPMLVAPGARDAALLRALAGAGARRLGLHLLSTDPRCARGVARAVRTWARASKATARLARGPWRPLAARAARAGQPRRAWVAP